MKFSSYEQKFREKSSNSGYSEENTQKCLNYARPLLELGLPVIYNTSHLSALVGYKKSYIKRAVQYTPYFYRTFKVRKKKSGYRIISEPLPSLKEIQNWILQEILYKIPISRFAKAYVPKRTIIDNVKYHNKKERVLALDINSFFDNITFDKVEKLFQSLGYSKLISNLLGKLCTLSGILPQGAPSSPCLTNILMRDFDKTIGDFAIANKIRFTRYADDITFSGKFDHNQLIQLVKIELSKSQLALNEKKTSLMTKNQRQVVTGIVVNKKPQVPKEKRKELRQALYYIEKFGLKSHLEKINCTKSNYIKHLLGLANFILYINPFDKEVVKYKITLNKLKYQSVVQ